MSIYDKFIPAQLSPVSQLGYQIEPGTFLGGTLNGSLITATGNQAISQNAKNLLTGYTEPTTINGQSILGPIPNTSDFSGTTWNDLSKLQQKRMLRAAQKEQSENSGESGDRGGSTGFDWSPIASGVGSAMQLGSTLFGKQYDDPQFAGEQAASKFLGNFGVYGKIAAGITSLSSQLTRKFGIDVGNVSQGVNKTAGGSELGRIANNVVGGLSNMTGGWGSLLGNKLSDFNVNTDTQSMFGAYSGTGQKMLAAKDIAGSNILFNKKEYGNLVNDSIINQDLMTNLKIGNDNVISSVPYNANMIESRNFKKIYGTTGQNYGTRIGKSGIKMLSREELDKIYSARKRQDNVSDDIQKFQNGGSILIPDGALHAHKHHMEDVNPELAEDLTKKGIPVVSTDENGEVTQVAEIEKQEIIFEKSLTEQIEKLWKEGSEEAMIEAGKLIAETLMTNCDDNVNLVKEVE